MNFDVPDDGCQVLVDELLFDLVARIGLRELTASAVARDLRRVVKCHKVGMNGSMLLMLVQPRKSFVMIGDVQVIAGTESLDEMKSGVEGNDGLPFGRQ